MVRQQSWESFTCYDRHSQEACLSCKPRAAFGSRLARHASSLSDCMGPGKARTCMTLHAPGGQAALVCCKAHPKRSPTSSYAQGKTIPSCFEVGQTQAKTWDRQSHRWGMQSGQGDMQQLHFLHNEPCSFLNTVLSTNCLLVVLLPPESPPRFMKNPWAGCILAHAWSHFFIGRFLGPPKDTPFYKFELNLETFSKVKPL